MIQLFTRGRYHIWGLFAHRTGGPDQRTMERGGHGDPHAQLLSITHR